MKLTQSILKLCWLMFVHLSLTTSDRIICNNSTNPCGTARNETSLQCRHNTTEPCVIECNGFQACKGIDDIICGNNADCFVRCNGAHSCETPFIDRYNQPKAYGPRFHCPLSPHSCNIYCDGEESCHDAGYMATNGGDLAVTCIGSSSCEWNWVNCPSAPHKCTVTCDGSWACYALYVMAEDSAATNVSCMEPPGSCNYLAVDCPLGAYDCAIRLFSNTRDMDLHGGGGHLTVDVWNNGFDQSFVYCPTDAVCDIICHNKGSCTHSYIHGRSASELNLYFHGVAIRSTSQHSIKVECPSRSNTGKHCNIYSYPHQSDDIVEPSPLHDLQLYTVEGVNGFNLFCYYEGGCFDAITAPIVYCDAIYGMDDCWRSNIHCDSCLLKAVNYTNNEWQCSDGSSRCATIAPTGAPTIEPTIETIDPTDAPSDPTTEPTTDPITEPTIEPTTDPTTDPTTEPTADPFIIAIDETKPFKDDETKPGLSHSQMILLFWAFGVTLALVFATCVGLLCWQQMRLKAMQVQINVLSDANDGDTNDGAKSQDTEAANSQDTKAANSQDTEAANSQDTEAANSQANPAVIVQPLNHVLSTPMPHNERRPEESSSDDDGIYGGPPKEPATGEEVHGEEKGKGSHLVEDVDEGRDYTELRVWMKHVVGLEQYTQTMIWSGYEDISTLPFITTDDLKEAGIANAAHRQRIYDLAQQKPQTTATTQHQTQLQATAAQQKPKQIQLQTTGATPQRPHAATQQPTEHKVGIS